MTRIAFILASLSVFAHPCLCAADVHVGDAISIFGQALSSDGNSWGSEAPPGVLANGQPHIIGSTTVYGDSVSGPAFPVTVTSSAASDGLSGFVTIDYSLFGPQDFLLHFATIILKDDGSISAASIIDGPGALTIVGGNSINYTVTGVDLFFDPIVTIGWTQVPGPAGAGLLLGLLIGKRQRRR